MREGLGVRDDLKIIGGWVTPMIATKKGALGKYIATTRIELGFTQKQMAEILGITGAMLSSIERREKPISPEQIKSFVIGMGLNEHETNEFVRLSVMNNVAIKAEKIIEKIGKCWE